MPFLGFIIRERKNYLIVANANDFYENDKSYKYIIQMTVPLRIWEKQA
jgi:hypothetical protein